MLVLLAAVVSTVCTTERVRTTTPLSASASPSIGRSVDAMVLRAIPPWPPGPVGVVDSVSLIDDHLGFLAGREYQTSPTSVIQRTSDGGATWTTVWSGDDVYVAWVGPVEGTIRAITYGYTGTGAPRGGSLLISRDRGSNWIERDLTLPRAERNEWLGGYIFHVFDGGILASPDIATAPCCGGPPLVSRDGGRTWSVMSIGAEGIASVDIGGTFGVASGHLDDDCWSAIWTSRDAGRTWDLLPRYCREERPGAVDVVNDVTAFVGTGDWDSELDRGSSSIWRTGDAGLTWTHALDVQGGPTIARLTLDAAGNGLVAIGGCISMGGDGPCVQPFVLVRDAMIAERTDQVGYRWAVFDDVALATSPPFGREVGLARSLDRGATWATSVRADGVPAWRLRASPKGVWADTPLGIYMSADDGGTWQPADRLPAFERYGVRMNGSSRSLEIGGTTLRLPGFVHCQTRGAEGGSVAWVVCNGSSVLVTSDVGSTFSQVRMPSDTPIWDIVPVSAREAWATTDGSRLLRTTDGGVTWIHVWLSIPGLSA